MNTAVSIFKNWQDYEKLRDPKKLLIIYGAGKSGKHFLNVNNVIPDYFADKNFAEIKEVISNNKKHKIPCISPQEFEKILRERAVDVMVSNIEFKTLRSILSWFKAIELNENIKLYFYHNFNVATGRRVLYSKTLFINKAHVLHGVYVLNEYFSFLIPNRMFKKAMEAFKHKNLTKKQYLNLLRQNPIKPTYKNNFLVSDAGSTMSLNKVKNTVYLIGACSFFSYYVSAERFKIQYILQRLLNKYRANFYSVESNLAVLSVMNEVHLNNIKNLVMKKGDIVIVSHVNKPELALQAKYICEKQGCRFICYMFSNILSRKYLSDYEKFIAKKSRVEFAEKIRYRKQCKDFLDNLNYLDVEAYEPPDEFFNSKETIMLDDRGSHFGDYGNEIIAKHLFNIITEKVTFKKNYNKDIEVGMNTISKIIPEIYLYAEELKQKYKPKFQNCGSIVMNCNPFTFGHLHLIEYAASKVEYLYIFVVEEDKSQFKFKDRFKLVKENTKHLKNIKVLPSGKFIISNQTFGEYFFKSELTEAEKPDVSLDLLIFSAAIAPTLNIKTRFVGEEPLDPVTKHYNEEMKHILPKYGLEIIEIPRKEKENSAISASRVRKLLSDKNFKEIRKLVPKVTYEFLKKI